MRQRGAQSTLGLGLSGRNDTVRSVLALATAATATSAVAIALLSLAFGRPTTDAELVEFFCLTACLFAILVWSVIRTIKRTDSEQRQTDARQAATFGFSADCAVVTDRDAEIIDVNPASEVLFGRASEYMIGQRLPDLLIPEALRAPYWQGLARQHSEPQQGTVAINVVATGMRADGSEFSIELSVATAVLPGSGVCFIHYLRLKRDPNHLDALSGAGDWWGTGRTAVPPSGSGGGIAL